MKVETGVRREGLVEIRGGLQSGDEVVVDSQFRLCGAPVAAAIADGGRDVTSSFCIEQPVFTVVLNILVIICGRSPFSICCPTVAARRNTGHLGDDPMAGPDRPLLNNR